MSQSVSAPAPVSRFRIAYRLAMPYFRTYKGTFVLGFAFLLATNLVQIAIPWLLKTGVDLLSGAAGDPEILGRLGWTAALIALAALLQACTRVGSRWYIFRAGRDIEYDVRQRAYRHVLALDSEYYRGRSRGDTISRVVNDIGNVRLLFGFGVLSLLNTVVAYIFALTVMMILSWKLTLLALLPFPLLFFVLRNFGLVLHRRFMGAQESLGSLSGFLQEALQGFEVVKGFAQEEGFFARFQEKNEANYVANMQLAWARSVIAPLMIFISGFGIFVVLAGGGYFVIQGEITIGDFVAFQGDLGMLVWPTLALGWLFNILERGQASLVRVDELLQTPPEVRDRVGAAPLKLAGRVEIHAAELRIDIGGEGQGFALKGIDIAAQPGQRWAIVGKTGGGKTTLLRTLQRLVDVPAGTVSYDGQDVNKIELASFRAQLGYLPQEPFLFGHTIRQALEVGLPEHSEDRLWQTLTAAAIADEIAALPQGLETRLGERGVSLSGGQRQRLMIARLLLTDPRVLFFDAPLAALDFATADRVRETLVGFAAGRTVFWATHRLDRMQWFDRIVLLEDGRVTACGTHEELLALPLYGALYQRQQLLRSLEAT